MGLKPCTRSHSLDGAERAIAEGAEADVVIALVIGVPGYEDGTVSCRRDGRFPIVGGRVADAEFGLPGRRSPRAKKDVALSLAKALVDDINAAVGSRCGPDEVARSGGGELLGRLPSAGFAKPRPDVPEIAIALGPEEPQVA